MEDLYDALKSVVTKKLWKSVRIGFFMMRKGLISKRKLLMDLNLMMKRGKLLRRSLANLLSHNHHHHHFHHFHHHHKLNRKHKFTVMASVGPREYEFSCSNSPSPVFSHLSKPKLHFFPCIDPSSFHQPEPKAMAIVPRTPDYNSTLDANDRNSSSSSLSELGDNPIMVSNYSSEDDEINCYEQKKVDDDAEEFIRRFYEQLRQQKNTQLLQYQEMQYQEMLARGTT